MRTRGAYTDRRVKKSDLHGLSKAALQNIIKSQKKKWPTLTLGKLTRKMTIATMCTALLDDELGFTIRVRALEAVPKSREVQGSSNENLSTVEGVATASEGATIDPNVPNLLTPSDGPDRDQAAATSAEQPVEREVTNLSKPEDYCAIPVQSNTVMEATTEAALDFTEPSPFVLGAETNFNRPAGLTYGLNDGLDLTNPTLYAPLGMGQEHLFNGSNHGQPLASSIPGREMPDFPDTVLDGAGATTTTVDNTGQTSTGQGCSTGAGVKPGPSEGHIVIRLHHHLCGRRRVPPEKSPKKNGPGELSGGLDNPGAVKSWKLGVEFLNAYSGVRLVDGEYRKISKVELSQALGVGKTWLSDANKAVRIVQTYGEGGTHRSQLFIDKITSTAGVPEGSTKLLDWLKTWSKEHPV
ncbi:hypothetical protein EDB84DRAFT_1563965 [Lactarius hengduanensis]|nr:hypothetical protein EDB84DRAFT_1563965 [Lactarius hengduanensis]